MIIGIDAMGGDNAPEAVLNGIELAFNNGFKEEIQLYGDENVLQRLLFDRIENFKNIKIVHCSEIIEGDDKPVMAIRKKKDSSIVKACTELKEGKIDAFISAGNTGALLAAGTLVAGRIKGIKRPALTTVYPTEKGFAVLSDVGANAECSPDNIEQFALMSMLYSREILDVKDAKVGLLNIGTEETKGTETYIEAHKLLKNNPNIDFAGNLESKDLLKGEVDVVVCDGFTGNIALKLIEGLSKSLFSMIKEAIMSSGSAKLGGALIKKPLKGMKDKLNPSKYGGAPLLGTNYPVIKAHGSSDDVAIMNAIFYAEKYVNSGMIDKLQELLNKDKIDKKTESENKDTKENSEKLNKANKNDDNKENECNSEKNDKEKLEKEKSDTDKGETKAENSDEE